MRGLDQKNPTGVFFNEQTIDSLSKAIHIFEENIGKITRESCRKNALRFNKERFRCEFRDFVESKLTSKLKKI